MNKMKLIINRLNGSKNRSSDCLDKLNITSNKLNYIDSFVEMSSYINKVMKVSTTAIVKEHNFDLSAFVSSKTN